MSFKEKALNFWASRHNLPTWVKLLITLFLALTCWIWVPFAVIIGFVALLVCIFGAGIYDMLWEKDDGSYKNGSNNLD